MPKKPLILIADDDRDLRAALSTRLTISGFDVVSASDAQTAITSFDQRHPDAAILDVTMPDSDGLSVCEYIRKSNCSIPVFILTGADTGIIRHNLDKLTAAVGADHYITKPYDGKALMLMLRDAVENKCRTISRRSATGTAV